MQTIRRLGTHSGTFHADEVTGIMFLKNFVTDFKSAEIVRTRDSGLLDKLDLIIDVGGEYSHERMRYDHHQKGFFETFSEKHSTKLSSAGLVYKHYGEEILTNALLYIFDVEQAIDKKFQIDLSLDDLANLKVLIYNEFVEYIDGIDNGISQYPKEVVPKYKAHYTDMVSRIGRLNGRSILKEALSQDQLFIKAMEIAREDFLFEVKYKYLEKFVGVPIVKEAFTNRFEVRESGRIIFIETACNWKEALFQAEKSVGCEGQVLFVIYHDQLDGNFRVQAVPASLGSFELRHGLKEEWRGLRDGELEKASGIPETVFCHINGFIAVGKSFASVASLAKLSLPA
jgi:uncharacterized UPF0160 family protein